MSWYIVARASQFSCEKLSFTFDSHMPLLELKNCAWTHSQPVPVGLQPTGDELAIFKMKMEHPLIDCLGFPCGIAVGLRSRWDYWNPPVVSNLGIYPHDPYVFYYVVTGCARMLVSPFDRWYAIAFDCLVRWVFSSLFLRVCRPHTRKSSGSTRPLCTVTTWGESPWVESRRRVCVVRIYV